MSYLDRDFSAVPGKPEDNEFKAEMLKKEMMNLQNTLPAFGVPAVGDLFSTHLSDVEATVKWYRNKD